MSDAGFERDFAVGPFRDAATAWLAADKHSVAVAPHPASTVLLLRDAPLEVFLIERVAELDVAPSTWVFPGGRVDPADAQVPMSATGAIRVAQMARQLGERPELTRAWAVAAVRELFEEAGVLLATGRSGEPVGGVNGTEWERRRADLEAHRASFAEVLGGYVVDLDLLTVVDRWITPEFERRRYDTVFFLAVLPDAARAEAVTREAQQGCWVSPARMLDAADRGEVQLLPPTRTRLLSLAAHADVRSALTVADGGAPVRATRPWAVAGVDGPFLRAVVNP